MLIFLSVLSKNIKTILIISLLLFQLDCCNVITYQLNDDLYTINISITLTCVAHKILMYNVRDNLQITCFKIMYMYFALRNTFRKVYIFYGLSLKNTVRFDIRYYKAVKFRHFFIFLLLTSNIIIT